METRSLLSTAETPQKGLSSTSVSLGGCHVGIFRKIFLVRHQISRFFCEGGKVFLGVFVILCVCVLSVLLVSQSLRFLQVLPCLRGGNEEPGERAAALLLQWCRELASPPAAPVMLCPGASLPGERI